MVEQYQDFMNKIEKLGFLSTKGILKNRFRTKKKIEEYQNIKKELELLTNFAPGLTHNERMRLIRHNITSENYGCPVCGSPRKYNGSKSAWFLTCNSKDDKHKAYIKKQAKKNHEKTFVQKYGVKAPAQHPEFLKKMQITCQKRYGVINPFQNKEIRKMNKIKWKAKEKEIKRKMAETCLKKYGVDNYAKTQECKEKARKTCKEKYGVPFYQNSKEYLKRLPEIKEKTISTNLEKYGSPFYSQSEEYKSRLSEIKEKTISVNLKKYSAKYYTQSEHYREKLPEIKKKLTNTILEKYGAPTYTQSDTHKAKIYNFDNYKKLSKEFIEETFLDENKKFNIKEFMDFINCERTAAYKILHKFGVSWNYGLGGFDPNRPGVLYYIKDTRTNLYKIGITNNSIEDRFGSYIKNIEVIKTWYYENGQEAYLAEQEILTAFGYYRIINESWSEEVGGRTEFFDNDILQLDV